MATTLLRPDQTFYPSPRLAGEAPVETLAYMVTFDPTAQEARRAGDPRRRPEVARTSASRPAAWRCRTSATSCTTSAGTHAARPSAPTRRTRTSSAATCWCRGFARRASTSSTSSPTLASRSSCTRSSRGDRLAGRLQPPAHHPLRSRRHLRERARRSRRQRPGRHLHRRPRQLLGERALGARPRAAGARLRLLVAPRIRHRDHQRVGHAQHGRGRRHPRDPARRRLRPQAAHLGPPQAAPQAGDRPRQGKPDGARAAPGARSDQGLRLCRRGHELEGPQRIDLGLAPRRLVVQGREGHRDPGRARLRGRAAAAAQRASRQCRRSSPTSTSRSTTSSSTSRLGHRRVPAVRRERSVQAEEDGQRAPRRHRAQGRAPDERAAERRARRWSR